MAKAAGRPRTFDMDKAIALAQAVFWRHGYEATSLTALASEIGVHKPSLYLAYGDKRALYLAAYDAYQRDASRLVQEALGKPTLRAALQAFFKADIALFGDADGRGCFMLATALPLAMSDADIGVRVRQALNGLAAAIGARVHQGAAEGELNPQIDVATATELLMSLHIALANRARSGETAKALATSARRTIELISRVESDGQRGDVHH